MPRLSLCSRCVVGCEEQALARAEPLQIETGATGLEPATSGVTGRRSDQLNYAPRTGAIVAVFPRGQSGAPRMPRPVGGSYRWSMEIIVILLLLALVFSGPLAYFYGVDSRIDEHRRP